MDKGDPDLFAKTHPLAWHGKLGNVFCVDFSAGGRWGRTQSWGHGGSQYKLAALRWPERQIQFDDASVHDHPDRVPARPPRPRCRIMKEAGSRCANVHCQRDKNMETLVLVTAPENQRSNPVRYQACNPPPKYPVNRRNGQDRRQAAGESPTPNERRVTIEPRQPEVVESMQGAPRSFVPWASPTPPSDGLTAPAPAHTVRLTRKDR